MVAVTRAQLEAGHELRGESRARHLCLSREVSGGPGREKKEPELRDWSP